MGYRQRYLHRYNHRTVGGWTWIRRNRRVAVVTVNPHYEVQFSIIPRRRVNGWSNILHTTGTNRNCCGWADRVPAVWFYSRATRMHIRSGHAKSGNHGLDPPNHLPWNRVSHVKIRAHNRHLCVWIWGATRYGRCIGHGTRRWGGRAHFYVSDPWHHQAGAQISNVWFRHMNTYWRYIWAYRWRYKWAYKWVWVRISRCPRGFKVSRGRCYKPKAKFLNRVRRRYRQRY